MNFRYRLISPCDRRNIAKKTVATCLISWSSCLVAFGIIFLMNPRLSTLITAAAAIVLTNSEVVGRTAKIYEITTLFEIQKLISQVEHNYYIEYRVDDSLYRSLDNLDPNMKKVAEQIYDLLLSDDREAALREYYENVPSKFLRVFVNQCVSAMERGDQTVDGKILFIRNMENLYREIEIEIDKLQRLQMEFIGVIVCVVVPIFCIDFVKQFAISIKENMVQFFYGKEGFLIDIVLIIVISVIYFIMRKSAEYKTFHQSGYQLLYQIDSIPPIKKAMDNYCDKNASKMERLKRELRNNGSHIRPRHFVLRSFLLAGIIFILSISSACYLHELSKSQLITADIADIEILTSAAKENQYKAMKEIIEKYTRKYVLKSKSNTQTMPKTQEEMFNILKADNTFYNPIINQALASEILRRVKAYQEEYFSLADLVISLLLSMTAFYLPYCILQFNSTVSKEAMEDEVNQFNAIISMLMYVDSMTVKQILEELESFSTVFKQSLRICINDFGSGDIEALKELIDREPYEPFNRIIDNLIRCDDMPIYEAFHEIDVERDGYMTKRKLQNEKSIRKRVFRAYMLAAVPFILLFTYGIAPTLQSSINEINSMLEELDSSSW